MLYNLLESWNDLVVFLSSSWILWWCCPRTQWFHRITWISPWLSQLCQLYMADNNRREEPNPAYLHHAGAGRRLWYCIRLWWSAVAWQLKNEVRKQSLIIIFSCILFPLSLRTLLTAVANPLLLALLIKKKPWHLDSSTFLWILISPKLEMTQTQRTVSVSFNLTGFSFIWDK